MSNAEIVEMALATDIAGRPIDREVLEKARAEADKDLQAEEARRLPLVDQAREVAEEMGLLGEASQEDPVEEQRPCDSDLLVQALGALTWENQASLRSDDDQVAGSGSGYASQDSAVTKSAPVPERPRWVVADASNQVCWSNPRLRFTSRLRRYAVTAEPIGHQSTEERTVAARRLALPKNFFKRFELFR